MERRVMRTESNRKPEPIEIRKLGIIENTPVVYLYLNSDIKQETHLDMDNEETIMYVYDSEQITSPIPATLLPLIDLNLITRHNTNQTDYKQKTMKHLEEIKKNLKEATKHSVKQVDRLDKLSEVTDLSLVNIKKEVEIDVKQL